MLRAPDSTARYQVMCAINTDNYGYPWAIWERWWDSHVDLYSEVAKWNGSNWEQPRRIPDSICFADLSQVFDFTFDQNNELVIIYDYHDYHNYCDIYSARYDPVLSEWELPQQVNGPDTTPLDDFQPRIAIGGGEIWATWFNENGDSMISNIKASHWNRSMHHWEPEMTVNPDSCGINRFDWYSNIVVDANGIPHLVWAQMTPTITKLRYSKYENNHWTPPIYMTNPESVIPIGPHGAVNPKVVIDNQNILHCVFPGYRPDPDTIRVKVFYTKNNGSGWIAPITLDTFSGPTNNAVWSCDIAVENSNNIWVVWDRGTSPNWKIYASHFDGMSWLPQTRIDDGKILNGGFPRIALDGSGVPFVAWTTDTIWYNRFVSTGVAEIQQIKGPKIFKINSIGKSIKIDYTITHAERVKICIYDLSGKLVDKIEKLQASGKLAWDIKVPQGVYFIHLETPKEKYRAKAIIIR